ncbi:MAG: hypothetical protein A3I73_05320 [Omnitrophica bacterium RIFCSPLOWO2_02_FULL_45_16]|nr:MAG: hypothetical protein A3C51_00650 [Omnitrophica bacterium RIFCSPHIGHO2_02_FULL_46_20]OGW93714.1 MAG: hypothetical protein A3K16_01820 [Omnitrophica bacterium RIFCSPLOWO2_01_FULL_45_24]OGX00880.1 MAG: hypothetical protein A3I73_05320 [Omnitrophica bacterium RIFCSPLOWO2_02_FULL_45_16]
MPIKKKSVIVALVSSLVIALVLILTLVGYLAYIEFKGEEFKRYYSELLDKAKARVYSKYIDITKLDVRIENTGPLKGKPIIEGVVTNKGAKQVAYLVIKVNFLDKDNAVIYEVLLRPQEPALGGAPITHVAIPYLYTPPKAILKPNEQLAFKKIITNCPTEIFVELREGDKPKKTFGKWSGKLTSQSISLDF